MYRFKTHIAHKYRVQFGDEADIERSLWKWSVDNIKDFWGEVWDFTGIRASVTYQDVVDEAAPIFPRPAFFKGAKLNFAENLLYPGGVEVDEDKIAVVAATEEKREEVSWKELRERVRACAAGLTGKVEVGQRVVGMLKLS
jgi:acetoacetyl-CoA synthetase